MAPKKSTNNKSQTRRRMSTANSLGSSEPKRARRLTKTLPRLSIAERKTGQASVLTVGQGEVGQLGLGSDVLERKRFALVPGLNNVVEISCGGMHTVCLTEDGAVYSFGCNDEGALGRITAEEEEGFVPGQVELDGKAVQISAGDSHTAVLLEDGRVFAWGSFRDSHGSMGLLTKSAISKTPTQVRIDEEVVKVSSGADHLVLLTAKGQLFTCGCPEQGQLGRVAARSANRDSRVGLSAFLNPMPITFRQSLHFKNVWATTYGTFAADTNDAVYVSGLNNYHQLALPDIEPPVYQPKVCSELSNRKLIKVEGGEHHTLLLDSDGKVYSLGRKEYGRLGLGVDSDDAVVPTLVPALESIKCTDIGCGSSVSFAVAENGACYGWGFGTNYQLGNGSEDDVHEPQLIEGKQLENKRVIAASAGGQHSAILVKSKGK